MLTGPKATAKKRLQTSSLARRVRATETLLQAWRAIERNGLTSRSPKTKRETKEFAADLPRQLRLLQERLRKTPYQFARQYGATPEKAKGKGKRPLVIAPIEDRIVQRAILDVLQDAVELSAVQAILSTPTSIGGIRGRGVEHAIKLIDDAHNEGNANFVAGSDISGFFTKIRQSEVVDFIRHQTEDGEFVDLFSRALKVELANASEMDPEDLKMFPTDHLGVAQGCPLSAFAGNVALKHFDQDMNGRSIICIRYIDDFILLGRHKQAVAKAFASAEQHLTLMGMSIYKPEERPDKAFFGPISEAFDFLGYRLIPGVYPPASKNRTSVLGSVRAELDQGRAHILRALNGKANGKPLQLYAQSLVAIDGLLRAWSGSFRASRCLTTALEIDQGVNDMLRGFIGFYLDKVEGRSQTDRRRALGVHVMSDDIRRKLSQESKTSDGFKRR